MHLLKAALYPCFPDRSLGCAQSLSVSSSLSSCTDPSLEETFITILLIPSHIFFLCSLPAHPPPSAMVYSIFPYIPLLYISFQLFLMNPYQNLSLSFSGLQVFSHSFLPSHLSLISFTLFLFIVLSHSTRSTLMLLFPLPPDQMQVWKTSQRNRNLLKSSASEGSNTHLLFINLRERKQHRNVA